MTFSARGPFGPWPTVNVTCSPSRIESNGVLVQADWWKKYSVPSGAAMKPKPLSVMRLIVPVIAAIRLILSEWADLAVMVTREPAGSSNIGHTKPGRRYLRYLLSLEKVDFVKGPS